MKSSQANIINLIGGPGSGKSTTAAGLFYQMKGWGLNVELITEYARELVYDGRTQTLANQIYILGKQYNRIHRVLNSVDWVITDSPILLSYYYDNGQSPESFKQLVFDLYNSMNNYTYFINRSPEKVKNYLQVGRTQTLEESQKIDTELRQMLELNDVEYQDVYSVADITMRLINR